MLLIKKHLTKIIEAAILLTVGILIIIAGAANGNSQGAKDAVSTISGVVMCVIGGITLVLLAFVGIKSKASFAAVGASSAALIGVGISLFDKTWLFPVLELMISVIPYVLISVGAVIILDGVLTLLRAIKGKGLVFPPVVAIVTGAVALTLGCLCIGNNPVIGHDTQLVVFGIIVVVLAAVALLTTLATAAKER